MSAGIPSAAHRVSAAKWKLMFLLALWVTLFLLLLPGEAILSLKIWVASWLPYAQMLDESSVTDNSDKWVHFSLFAVLGALTARIWSGHRAHNAALWWLVALAIGTECIQHFIPGRSASLGDFAIDIVGLAAGSIVMQMRERRAAPARLSASGGGSGGR